MGADHPAHGHHNPIPQYLGVFAFLFAVTAFELLPLFGLLEIPAPLLLFLSAVKFTVVVLFFMHLYGDKAINNQLFFIPLVMAGGSVGVLMLLAGTWKLAWPVVSHVDHHAGTRTEVRDGHEIVERYRGRWTGDCNAWAKSAITGNEYCASPWVAFSPSESTPDTLDPRTMAPLAGTGFTSAYDALQVKVAPPDPAFDGWDGMSDDAKKALLMEKGEVVYNKSCASCHMKSGEGLPGNFPPLKGDPVANGGDVTDHITIVLKGLSGREIAGVKYASAMQPWASVLNDQEIASVVTFERNTWGNSGGVVQPAQVTALR